MSKLICFRVDEKQKARIEAAAINQNKTVTTFVKENIMKAVEDVESRQSKQPKRATLFDEVEEAPSRDAESPPVKQAKRRAAVPSWFRSLCREAARGGSFGFHRVGYRWASNMPPGPPPGFTPNQWHEQLEEIKNKFETGLLMRAGGKKWREAVNESILKWFRQNFPSQMDLIPRRRQNEFAEGFLDAGEDVIRTRSK